MKKFMTSILIAVVALAAAPAQAMANAPKMIASIGMPQDIPSMIAFLKQAGALARDWAPPEGIVFLALWAWLMILMLMFWKFMK